MDVKKVSNSLLWRLSGRSERPDERVGLRVERVPKTSPRATVFCHPFTRTKTYAFRGWHLVVQPNARCIHQTAVLDPVNFQSNTRRNTRLQTTGVESYTQRPLIIARPTIGSVTDGFPCCHQLTILWRWRPLLRFLIGDAISYSLGCKDTIGLWSPSTKVQTRMREKPT